MRNTENLSLRLDPEVIQLARRSAEETEQTLREFFEGAVRRHVAALTGPEERTNLLSSVEEALLHRIDQRLKDVVERIAALSAKEAIDQAHALQIIKRVLYMQTGDQAKARTAINTAWDEATERVRGRGRPLAAEVAENLEAKLAEREKSVAELKEALQQTKAALQSAQAQNKDLKEQAQKLEEGSRTVHGRAQSMEFELGRERWVSEQLERQGLNPIGRKTAAELRRLYTDQHSQGRWTS